MGQITYGKTAIDASLATKAASSHTHAASDVTSGTIATSRLGSGTANDSSYLRGDQTWAAVAAGGDTLPIVDSTAVVKGSSDATKLLRFEVDGFTTGTTRVLTPPNADGTIALVAGSDTHVLFNDGGVVGADADLTWNKTTNALYIGSNGGISCGNTRASYFLDTNDRFEIGLNLPGLWLRGDYRIAWSNNTTGAYYSGVTAGFRRSAANTVTFDSDGAGGAASLVVTGALTAASLNLGGATVLDVLSATAALNFGSIAAGASADLTITVTGAVAGDSVILGRPAAEDVDLETIGFVSAADTVTIRAYNNDLTTAVDPGALTYRATCLRI